MTTTTDQMTPASQDLFTTLAADAGNWNGEPLLGGNFTFTAAMRGNLTDLKKRGLVTTFVDEGDEFVQFTDAGVKLAAEIGHKIEKF